MSQPSSQTQTETEANTDHSWRFSSLCCGFVVAYTPGRKMAAIVQFDNEADQWHCYCEDVRFTRMEGRRGTADFICAGRQFSRPYLLVGPWSDDSMVMLSHIDDAADEVFGRS